MLFFPELPLYRNVNKNEFVTRTYTDGIIVNNQKKSKYAFHYYKNRIDWNINEQNSLTVSGLFGTEENN
jgi:hypothetical protein